MKETPTMDLSARVHAENGTYWAEVAELPGCFASGRTLDELTEALQESIRLYLSGSGRSPASVRLHELRLTA
jgi:predicted RNase H-like HicB family nuclease